MNKKKRLGRGLEALLSQASEPASHEPSHTQAESFDSAPVVADATEAVVQDDEPRIIPLRTNEAPAQQAVAAHPSASASAPESSGPGSSIMRLNVHDIEDNPFQPRRDFSEPEIVSLAESLKEHDMLQPILVRKIDDRYQLISGERRLRAAIRAGWTTIPAQLREANDRLVAELAIVENLQRKDLNAIEKALSFRRYLDEHGSTQEELAQRLKIDRSTIANLCRLLELPDLVQQSVRTEIISAGHARALLSLGDEKLQVDYCNRIQIENWSVRETERQVADKIRSEDGSGDGASKSGKKAKNDSNQLAALEQEFRMALGTKVEIKKTAKGKGKITIQFNNVDEFERLRQTLCESVLHQRMAS